MIKFVSYIFTCLGAIFMIGSFKLFSLVFEVGLLVLVLGGAIICLGLSMNKIAKIEDKIGKFTFLPENEQKVLVTCEKCERIYEAEYGRCPYCGITTDFTK